MSYDLDLVCPESGEPIELAARHFMTGGTYSIGGSKTASLNVTYNYWEQFSKAFGDPSGIKVLEGMSGKDSIPVLREARDKLGVDAHPDYWKATEGNARVALEQLLALAERVPHGIWRIT